VIGALRVILGADTAQFETGMKRAQATMSGVGQKMQGIGAAMSLGITAPVTLIGKEMLSAAVNAEEMQSAFNVSFGSMSKSTEDWARKTGDALGRSTQELQQAALTMNGLFKAGGPATAQTAELSKEFAVLAQDLSSFHNIKPEEALDRLRAGLSGEAEPLRKFNVYLTEAAVKAEAMKLGLIGANGELAESAKIQARASLIMKGTTEAQGDVARTSESLANKQRALSAQWQELSVTVGTLLIPAITPLVSVLTDVAKWFGSLSPQMQTAIGVMAGLAAAVGPVVGVMGTLMTAMTALKPVIMAVRVAFMLLLGPTNPLGLIITAVTAVIAVWVLFGDDIKRIAGVVVDYVRRMYEGIKTWLLDKFSAIVDGVRKKVEAVKGFFAGMYDAVVGNSYVPDMVRQVGEWMQKLDGAMVDPARAANDNVAKSFAGMSDSVISSLGSVAKALASGDWKGALQGALGMAGRGNGKVAGWANAASEVLKMLPGFANGGSFTVGGSSGIDKNIVAIRATRGERVDVTPANQARAGGSDGVLVVRVDKSDLFDVAVQRAAAPMAAQAAVAGARGGAALGRQQMGRQARQTFR
jgi:hypothetical protein